MARCLVFLLAFLVAGLPSFLMVVRCLAEPGLPTSGRYFWGWGVCQKCILSGGGIGAY